MGKRHKDALMLNFDRKMKLEFHGTKVTWSATIILTFRRQLKVPDELKLELDNAGELLNNRPWKCLML